MNMSDKNKTLVVQGELQLDEARIFERVANIIETRKSLA
jgi:ABC-type phosphate transport system ATPase subunit